MLSLDIANNNIYLAEATLKGNSIKIDALSTHPLESPLVDGEGDINQESLQQALNPLLSSSKAKAVAITFSGLPVVTNEYLLPYVKHSSQRLQMVEAKVFQTLSPADYAMDYRITGMVSQEEGIMCNLITYIMPKPLIEATAKIIKASKKKPGIFAVTQNSIYNLAQKYCPEKVLVIANLNKKQINLHLLNLPLSIITRSKAIEAENNLNIFGNLGLMGLDTPEEEQDTLGNPENNPVFTQALDQISKLVQYQTIKYASLPIEKIYLMGEEATQQAQTYLAENLNLPTAMLASLPLAKNNPQQNIAPYFYALAAIL